MISFVLNGQPVCSTAAPTRRLSDVLREDLGLMGTKVGCDAGDCGACTILLDGRATCACLIPTARVTGCHVQTVEAETPELTRLRAAFLRHGAAQCGICTPGMLMAGADLLARNPTPSESEAETALHRISQDHRRLVRCFAEPHPLCARIADQSRGHRATHTPHRRRGQGCGRSVRCR